VSVEVPVFKHHYLKETIESVIKQTYKDWILYLLSDGASLEAEDILRQCGDNKKIFTRFRENKGICITRKELTKWSGEETDSDFILPVDHDDLLLPTTIEEMVDCHQQNPTSGIVRARRMFINENSEPLEEKQWFPFAPRKYFAGMTIDLHNHSQPYMIRRSAYLQTEGWDGFSEEFKGAGADCDIFLKIEEVSDIILLDRVLYRYRLNPYRFSLELGIEGAKKMYCDLADKTIARRKLKLKRVNSIPPFQYQKI
jgi:glycosyltransferase involved in cell wall biosynthesis